MHSRLSVCTGNQLGNQEVWHRNITTNILYYCFCSCTPRICFTIIQLPMFK